MAICTCMGSQFGKCWKVRDAVTFLIFLPQCPLGEVKFLGEYLLVCFTTNNNNIFPTIATTTILKLYNSGMFEMAEHRPAQHSPKRKITIFKSVSPVSLPTSVWHCSVWVSSVPWLQVHMTIADPNCIQEVLLIFALQVHQHLCLSCWRQS